MIFIEGVRGRLAVCRTYGAPEDSILTLPALTGWANLCRASDASEASGCDTCLQLVPDMEYRTQA
jgi:hypothetical protein